jgi:putative oxidoreductase
VDIIDTQRNSLSRWAPLLLRLIVGYGFMAHGYAKLVRGPHVFAVILRALGVPGPDFMAWATVLSRFLAAWQYFLALF